MSSFCTCHFKQPIQGLSAFTSFCTILIKTNFQPKRSIEVFTKIQHKKKQKNFSISLQCIKWQFSANAMFQFMYSIQCIHKSPYHQTVSWVLFIFLMSCQITIITTMMTDSERMLLKSVQMKPEVYISISI